MKEINYKTSGVCSRAVKVKIDAGRVAPCDRHERGGSGQKAQRDQLQRKRDFMP